MNSPAPVHLPVPERTERAEMQIVGLEIRSSNRREALAPTARIPDLWRRFLAGRYAKRIPGRSDPHRLLAVYTEYDNGDTGDYSVVVGAEVDGSEPVPEGMRSLLVPAGAYLRFEAEGPMPDALIRTWETIWDFFEGEPSQVRAYTADFEVHDWREPNRVEVYVAICAGQQ